MRAVRRLLRNHLRRREVQMSYAFHKRLRFSRTIWQRIWDFRVTARNDGFWATVWQAVIDAWREDFA